MPDDLKNYRAPRSPWPWIIAVAIITALVAYVGPAHYANDLETEAELKLLRAEQAWRSFAPMARPAPLEIKCPSRQWYADQPDGGAWLVRCIDADYSHRGDRK